jgi:hypothetical protein
METVLGHDLGGARIHTGPEAAGLARALGSSAFTLGRDIVFAEGRFSPGNEPGRRLLAHELTHVIQQAGVAGSLLSPAAAEREASAAADAVVRPRPVSVKGAVAPAVQRDGDPSTPAAPPAPAPGSGYGTSIGELKEPAVLRAVPGAKGVPPKFPGYDGFVGGTTTERLTLEGPKNARYWVVNQEVNDATWISIISPEEATPQRVEGAVSRKLKAAWEAEHNPSTRLAPRDPVDIGPRTKLRVINPGPAKSVMIVVNVPATGDPALIGSLQQAADAVVAKSTAAAGLPNLQVKVMTAGTQVAPMPAAPTPLAPAAPHPQVAEKPPPAVEPEPGVPKPPAGETPVPVPKTGPETPLVGKPPAPKAPGAAAAGAAVEGAAAKGTIKAPGAAAAGAAAEGAVAKGAATAAGRAVRIAAGALMEFAITIAISMLAEWLLEKIQQSLIQSDLERSFKSEFPGKWARLQPKLASLPSGRKLYVHVTWEYCYFYNPDPIMGGPPWYELGSARLVGLHPGNEELEPMLTPSSTKRDEVEPNFPPGVRRARVRNGYSILVDDPAKRAREREQAELAEKLKRAGAGATAPKPKAPSTAPPSTDKPPPLLTPPWVAPEPPKFEGLPGAPDKSREQQVSALLDWLRQWMTQLLRRGEGILNASPRPSDKEITDFAAAEQDWRNHATYAMNDFAGKGKEDARKALDEMLHADKQGGRLLVIRRNLGR